jgi:hypothetical protein
LRGENLIAGWWVDPVIKTITISLVLLKMGKNSLTIEGRFDRYAGLEALYLLGSFGVETDGMNSSLTKLPEKLKPGSWTDQGFPFYSGNMLYRVKLNFEPESDKRYLLKIPKFRGTAIEVIVNSETSKIMAWPPYEVDCTDALREGENTINIKVLGSRRNSFGPLHIAPEKPKWVGPDTYIPDAYLRDWTIKDWQETFHLLSYGLDESPILVECKIP